MIIGERVKIVCDNPGCAAKTFADMVLVSSGQMVPRVNDDWQLVAPRGQGTYVPAHVENGVLIPGRFQ